MNKILIAGRVGSDPKFHTYENGGKSAQFSVATNEYWIDRTTGEKCEETEWHRCVANGAIADRAERLTKGSVVAIEGRNRTRVYTDKSGIERSVTQVLISKIEIFDSTNKSANASPTNEPAANSRTPAQRNSQARANTQAKDETDEIPF